VVNEAAIGRIKPVGLTIIDGAPVSVELGEPVGRPRTKGRGLSLGRLPHHAVHLGSAGLVEVDFRAKSQDAYRLENTHDPERIGVRCVLGVSKDTATWLIRRKRPASTA